MKMCVISYESGAYYRVWIMDGNDPHEWFIAPASREYRTEKAARKYIEKHGEYAGTFESIWAAA